MANLVKNPINQLKGKFAKKMLEKAAKQLSQMHAKDLSEMFTQSVLPFLEGTAINVEITSQEVETPDGKHYYAIMFRDR